ncbi:hypothetical protein E3P81_01256 [Wallemia ichthyophaga]|nr:hypothetical protein E3P97_01257 [Wallemia ichthyophaga]TIB34178.1 hypothetical protein E3P85_01006 [Wallemia ichthyophaga]TIB48556.1 hypothetical protein E3P82_01255 [Wallemia ichthyophaga]TIB52586.1 hypothetical protein E3P81_01256 [Wallemia ichthyophaga]TIB55304.1 hypothetical protein E3P80_01256 [Wallemia ichthyophaga]
MPPTRRTNAIPSTSSSTSSSSTSNRQRPSTRITLDSDDDMDYSNSNNRNSHSNHSDRNNNDDEVQFRSARRLRGIDNGILVNQTQPPQQPANVSHSLPARPIRPRTASYPNNPFIRHPRHHPYSTHFLAMTEMGALRILHDSMPNNRPMMGRGWDGLGLDGVDARIRQRYHQLDIPLHQIGFGGVYHPHMVQPVKHSYSTKLSHPRKWPGFSQNGGPNVRSRLILDAASDRQLTIHGEGDNALYALRCGHVIDGNTHHNLIENNVIPKKRKTIQSKPYRQSRATSAINNTLRRHPFVTFGLPFITIMVVASFGMSTFTQTKYDRADGKVKELDKKEALQIQKGKKPVDLREEYFVSTSLVKDSRSQHTNRDYNQSKETWIIGRTSEYAEISLDWTNGICLCKRLVPRITLSSSKRPRRMSPIGEKGKESGTARVLGSGTSGIAELMVFHPIDTIAKRLMTNQVNGSNIKDVIFKQHATSPALTKALSLFPGLGYAAGYKVAQRVYKFGGQPYFNDILNSRYGSFFNSIFGDRNAKAIMSASAGSLTGIGEVVLLPLDVLKIKRQTNPESFKGRGIVKIVADEGFGLYRGWGWTMARNAPGSFALFGGSAVTKGYIFGLEDYSKATFYQNFFSSIGGAVSSITVAAPLDVVKTRIQQANFDSKTSGATVIKDIIKNEGPTAFFKGLTPKILVVGPKLVFSYTLAQTLIPAFGKYF